MKITNVKEGNIVGHSRSKQSCQIQDLLRQSKLKLRHISHQNQSVQISKNFNKLPNGLIPGSGDGSPVLANQYFNDPRIAAVLQGNYIFERLSGSRNSLLKQ